MRFQTSLMPNNYPDPVIFVPGIKGSALRDEYPIDPETVWSVLRAVVKSYDRIMLHPYNTRYEAQEPARVVRDQVFGLFYSEFIEELRHNLAMDPTEPVPVFPFAYDWRQPLTVIQSQFEGFVEEVIERTRLLPHYNRSGYNRKSGRVNLVGHSMGGLIIGGYVAKAGLQRVNRVATIATPFRGSLESIAITTTGTSSLNAGGSREREAARVTPSLYHLLPSYAGAVAKEAPNVLFESNRWQSSILSTLKSFVDRYQLPKDPALNADAVLATMLTQARAHRESLEKLTLPDPKQWLCVVGVNVKTRVSMSISKDAEQKVWFDLEEAVDEFEKGKTPARRTRTGDGTVPYSGAQCAFVPANQIICVTPGDYGFFELKDRVLDNIGLHANLPNMNLVQRLVVSHFLQRQQGDLGGCPGPDVPTKDWDPPLPKKWLS